MTRGLIFWKNKGHHRHQRGRLPLSNAEKNHFEFIIFWLRQKITLPESLRLGPLFENNQSKICFQKYGVKVHGLDLSHNMLAVARQRADELDATEGVTFEHGNVLGKA